MNILRQLYEMNEPVILFGYGLVFFVLGLAIALQSRQSSRLELARSLAWLAAFGIIHSLFEWGEYFSPVHEAYLSPLGIRRLHDVHLLLLSVSFACLLQFGIALLRPMRRGDWLHPATWGMLLLYAIVVIILLPRWMPDPHVWHATAEALARYLMGFPGGLLAAYGLRVQAYRHIAPLQVPRIVATLRLAGIALALYAIFGGLIPPPVPFFPGNWLNTDTFENALGFPPLVFQAFTGLTMAITIIRALEVFDVETERRIEQMEQQQILTAERERIARELHDRTIQTAYTAGLLVDSARKNAAPGSSLAVRLERAVTTLDALIADLRHSLGTLHAHSSGQTFASGLQGMAGDPRYRSLVEIHLEDHLPDADQPSPAQTDHLLAIVSEALANIVRHSRATNAWITTSQDENHLRLEIRDNGSGISPHAEAGYGLRNMDERARLLGGEVTIDSQPGRGTRVQVKIPVKNPREWRLKERKETGE